MFVVQEKPTEVKKNLISIHLDPAVFNKFAALADKSNLSRSELAVQMIKYCLQNGKDQPETK